MNLHDEVLYFGRSAWVVGHRLPNSNQHEGFYDLCRKSGSAKVDFKDVPERHLKSLPAVNEVRIVIAETNRLALVK